MAIMTRILRLWKADIHGVMDQLEDKELLAKQYLREMETALQKKERRLQHVADTNRRITSNITTRKQEIEKLEKDLTLALRKENDEIAKLLIRKQRIQQIHCEELLKQHECQKEEYKQLADRIDEQRLKYETLKVKAAAFCKQAECTTFTETSSFFAEEASGFSFDDEEIELELMRRKEALAEKGGPA